jgi:4-amino-4-deoxy-L-arabinose transferase-like glycosyltransferase
MAEALRDRWLLGFLAAGLLIRVAVALVTEDRNVLIGDDAIYVSQAEALVATGTLDTGRFVRPPLYFLFLAALQLLAEPWMLCARLLQCLAGVAAAIPVYATARRIAGARAARLGAAFLLFDPTLIAYCSLLWPETIFLLIASIIFAGIARLEPRARWRLVLLGAATGVTMLLKPVFGLFTVVLVLWWMGRFGPWQALRLALVFWGAAAVVIAPWVIRNQIHYGPAIILENQGPYNLWVGNDPRPALLVLEEWKSLGAPVVRSRVAMERGIAAIRADVPGFLRRSAVRALNLWGLEFFIIRNLIFNGYGLVANKTLLLVFWMVQLSHVVLWVTAAAGTGPASRDRPLRVVIAYAIVFTLVSATMVGTTRFRVPFAFLLSVLAGIGADRVLSRQTTRGGLVAISLALIVIALSASRPPFRAIASARFESVVELRKPAWFFFRY